MDFEMINHTDIPNEMLHRIITDVLSSFHQTYPYCAPHSSIRIIVCPSAKDVRKVCENFYGNDAVKFDQRDYDGNFLPPLRKTDVLTIVIRAKPEAIVGAKLFYHEREHGSPVRNGVLTNEDHPWSWEERERRGKLLIDFFTFIELLLHEYSHFCSYGELMVQTVWHNPRLPESSLDYHLHDEFLARYRGTISMLVIATPYMEYDLLFSLFHYYIQGARKGAKEMYARARSFVSKQRAEIESELLAYFHQNHFTQSEMVLDLEHELGHPLTFRNERTASGFPKMSDIEIAEYLAVDEMAERVKGIIYCLKNPIASYDGAQYAGIIQAFFDYLVALEQITEQDLLDMKLDETAFKLGTLIEIPFWSYIDPEKIKRENDTILHLLEKHIHT